MRWCPALETLLSSFAEHALHQKHLLVSKNKESFLQIVAFAAIMIVLLTAVFLILPTGF